MEILNKLFNSNLFEKHKRDLYTKAFADAYKDLEETNVYNTEEKAKELSKKTLDGLLSATDLTKIISKDKQFVYLGGNQIDDVTLNNLKAEAEFFKQSELWKVIYNTPKSLAEKAMFSDDGKIENQLLKGRSMLYMLDTQRNIIEILSNVKGR